MSTLAVGATTTASTYEATKAYESTYYQPDKIHWERDVAYRNQAYRHLCHQDGLIGTFQVRLLEAADLKRSYWSALALGPVKLLGLSKAHGPISSFCTISMKFEPYCNSLTHHNNNNITTSNNGSDKDQKIPAKKRNEQQEKQQSTSIDNDNDCPVVASPVIQQDNNPVWNNCSFDLPLHKGAMKIDGSKVFLTVRVDEDATAVEAMLPGVPSGGDSRLLGTGRLDITSLCLGQDVITGQPQVGVVDAWIPIRLPDNDDDDNDYDLEHSDGKAGDVKSSSSMQSNGDDKKITGRVRVLVSYRPHGMEPEPNDIVALEAFARRGVDEQNFSSCRPIMPSLLPLTVLQVNGPWILVEYSIDMSNSMQQRRLTHNADTARRKACLKVHRNTIFVVERKNLLDETVNLALLPADVIMASPFGRSTAELLGPIVIAGQHVLGPALLSARLFWMAVRTTTLASLTGVHAVTSTMWNEGTNSLTQGGDDSSNRHTRHQSSFQQRTNGNHKFVTL